MKTNTKDKIFEYIKGNNPCTINNLKIEFNISTQIIHRHILKLLEEWKIYKKWNAPKVFYYPKKTKILTESSNNNKNEINYFEEKFIYASKKWNLKFWFNWFKTWVKKKKLNLEKEISDFKEIQLKYDAFRNKFWLIKWNEKFKQTFDDVYLDNIYYLDFYSIWKYWKTYLWNLLFYAKQSWDKKLIEKIINYIKKPILNLIERKKIDAVWFIPPTLTRKIQLVDELKNWLWIKQKWLNIVKIFNDKVIAQNSLEKKEARVINARDTIFIHDKKFKCDTILLIDDLIWSWSTLNETARKIKEKGIAKKVIWLAIVWSFEWFEVINEI